MIASSFIFTPTEEATLFEAYLAHGLSISHLAKAIDDPELSTLDVLAWFNQPHIQQAFADLRRAHVLAAKIREAQAQFQAIETLESLATTDPVSTTRLRAAITLLRPRSRRHDRARNQVSVSEHGGTAPATNPERESTSSGHERPESPAGRQCNVDENSTEGSSSPAAGPSGRDSARTTALNDTIANRDHDPVAGRPTTRSRIPATPSPAFR